MTNTFSLVTGEQTKLLFTAADGTRVSLSKITDWDWKPDDKDVESIGLDGIREMMYANQGWSGSFTAEWQDTGLDDFFADQEADYQQDGTFQYGTLNVYMTLRDGEARVWQLINTAMTWTDAGKFQANTPAKMKVSFKAQKRVVVS